MSIDELQKSQLLDPINWISSAEDLLASATLFDLEWQGYWKTKGAEQKKHEKHLKAHLMLLGFALENLLKALIVQDQRQALESEFELKKELPQILNSHDLIKLAERARLHFSDDGTKELLARLTRHSVWAGRYPVPLRPSHLPAEDVFGLSSSDLVPISAYFRLDPRNTQILYQRAKQIIEERKMSRQSPQATDVKGKGAVL